MWSKELQKIKFYYAQASFTVFYQLLKSMFLSTNVVDIAAQTALLNFFFLSEQCFTQNYGFTDLLPTKNIYIYLFQKKTLFLVKVVPFTRNHSFSWKPFRLCKLFFQCPVHFRGNRSYFLQWEQFLLVKVIHFSVSDFFYRKLIHLVAAVTFYKIKSFLEKRLLRVETILYGESCFF